MNTIMLDACKKVGVVFEAVVASFEAVNCASLQARCLLLAAVLCDAVCMSVSHLLHMAAQSLARWRSQTPVVVPCGAVQGLHAEG